jgi:hypothetical protein
MQVEIWKKAIESDRETPLCILNTALTIVAAVRADKVGSKFYNFICVLLDPP